MIKAVLFDMDGTLVDSEKHYVEGTRILLKDMGYEINDFDLFQIIGKTMEQMNEYLSNLSGFTVQEINDSILHYFGEVNLINYSDYLYDDVIDTLKELKKNNIKIAICSGSEEVLINKFLKDCEMNDLIDLFVSSENLEDKPSPKVYLKAMELLNISPEECIIVEDSDLGIEAGKRANCFVYARDASRYGINQENADKIIKDLREILEVVV